MKNILVFAPHPDDEMIGVGGTIIKSIKNGSNVFVCVVTKGIKPLFSNERTEKNRNDCIVCHKSVGIKDTIFLEHLNKTRKLKYFRLNMQIIHSWQVLFH